MTNLYFLKIFFIDKIIPYSLMTLSIAYLLLEIIAPIETRNVFYDFSDRLFFKFIYRPISKFLSFLKQSIIKSLKGLKNLLQFNKRLKEKKAKRKEEKRLAQIRIKQEKIANKQQKRQSKLDMKLQKKQDKLYSKIESEKLKAETNRKLKMFLVNKIQNKEKSQMKANIKNQKRNVKVQNKLENKKLKAETNRKLKLFVAYKLKNLINKLQSK